MNQHRQQRHRVASLLRRYRTTRTVAWAYERDGRETLARSVWRRNLTIWCELMDMGIDPDEFHEVAFPANQHSRRTQ